MAGYMQRIPDNVIANAIPVDNTPVWYVSVYRTASWTTYSLKYLDVTEVYPRCFKHRKQQLPDCLPFAHQLSTLTTYTHSISYYNSVHFLYRFLQPFGQTKPRFLGYLPVHLIGYFILFWVSSKWCFCVSVSTGLSCGETRQAWMWWLIGINW